MFRLPEAVRRRVPGDVVVDSDGVRLRLHDSLEAFESPRDDVISVSPQFTTFPIVHGQLPDDRHMTLLHLSGVGFPGPFEPRREDWSVNYALIGGWTTDTGFDVAHFSFDALLPWVEPPGLT